MRDNEDHGNASASDLASTSAGSTKKVTFGDLGLAQWLTEALAAMSITTPSEIQRACIKPTLEGTLRNNTPCCAINETRFIFGSEKLTSQFQTGRDIIGGAKTGSGKTAAFALPILQKLSEDPYGIFALVLTPTRLVENAISIFGRFHKTKKWTKSLGPSFLLLTFSFGHWIWFWQNSNIRELAYQISDQFTVLGKDIGLKSSVVVGGMGECDSFWLRMLFMRKQTITFQMPVQF